MRAYPNEIVRPHGEGPLPVARANRAEGSAVEAIKPPRLNFARVCLRCDQRDCTAPECIAWHAESCWVVCPDCDGLCWTEAIEPCGCLFGVVEAYGPSAATRRLAAV